MCITMRSEPPALSFSAHGQVVGDLKVRRGASRGKQPRDVDARMRRLCLQVEVDTSRASSTLHSFDCMGGRVASRFAHGSPACLERTAAMFDVLCSDAFAAAINSSSCALQRVCPRL